VAATDNFAGVGGSSILLSSVFVAFEAAYAYSAMLPSIMTINTFVDSPDKILAIRQGELLATVFGGLFAVAVAIVTKNWLPILLTIPLCLYMVAVYEWALRRSPAWLDKGAHD
jgi:hypothetical protein